MAFEHIYRPQHKSDTEIVNDFVVRTAVFERLMADIRKDGPGKLSQHHIVQGLRGMGKSTLFERIRVEMKQPELALRFITVKTAEENWPVNSLLDFWIWIGQHMAAIDPVHFGTLGDLGTLWSRHEEHTQCLATLEAKLKGGGRKLLMLVDNVGDLFRKFSMQENHAFREALITSRWMNLVGGTAVRLDELQNHEAPYFDLFKVHQLNALNQQEVFTLLEYYASKTASKQVEQVVENEPHRVDHLRILTGGVPRTIMLLLDVFDKDDDTTVFDDLRRTLDLVTPLYKHRMDELSPQKQKIVHALAMRWDGMSAGEVAAATRLESKVVSAQLGQLVREGFVLRDETSTKNHFYQLAERFFNIWYLMNNAHRNGAAKVRWLTRFFELWCDEKGLKRRALKHLKTLERDALNPLDQLLITNALLSSDRLDRSMKELVYEHSLRTYPDHADQVLHESQWGEVMSPNNSWQVEVGRALARFDYDLAEKVLSEQGDEEVPWTWFYQGDLALYRGHHARAHEAYRKGLSLSEDRAKAEPQNAQVQRDLSIINRKLGDLLLQEGRGDEARKNFDVSLAIRQKLAEEDPRNTQAQRGLAVSYNRLGDFFLHLGIWGEARAAYALGLAVRRKLVELEPSSSSAQRGLAASYSRLGDVFVQEGNYSEARSVYMEGLAIRKALAEGDPDNVQALRDLWLSYHRLGDMYLQESNDAEARKVYEMGLAISTRLVQTDSHNAQAQRDLSVSYNKIGNVMIHEGRVAEAHASCEASLAISMKLVETDPSNSRNLRDLALNYYRLGLLLQQLGRSADARNAHEKGLAISRTQVSADPHNARTQRDLSFGYERLGDVLRMEGNGSEARKAYEMGLLTRQSLVETNPNKAQALGDLAILYWRLFELGEVDNPDAENHFVKYVSTLDAIAEMASVAWKEGDLSAALSITSRLCSAPVYTGGVLNALLWGIAREQLHGIRELFEKRFTRLKEEMRPVYFALLKLMQEEDPDSHRRMGKELEEPVREILARIEGMSKELDGGSEQRASTPAKAPRKASKRKK